ncbi:response regulator [Luteibacter sp.]|uniref:response regulator n=1 Tax=Luteibacter sp. TaxID=1886636 RepID=UPI003F7FF526
MRSHEAVAALTNVLSSLQDAETGQRGYLLTGNEGYLEPYRAAVGVIPGRLDVARAAMSDDPAQVARLVELKARTGDKLDELAQTIALRRKQGLEAALAVVNSDRGKTAMDDIRARLAAMGAAEAEQRARRLAEMERAYATALISGAASALLGVGLTLFVGVVIRRTNRARKREAWLQAGRLELSNVLAGDPSAEELGRAVVGVLTRLSGAQAAVAFAAERGRLVPLATTGLAGTAAVHDMTADSSLLGRAVADARPLVIHDVPEAYFRIGSALGEAPPRHLVIAPAISEGRVQGVIELGFFRPVAEEVIELLDQASAAIAVALRSAAYRADLARLLEETQRQAEELQTQSEELRVSNEELEEQSQALRVSQAELESQQAELEQTNVQLSEQTDELAAQRDALAAANLAMDAKAQEVQKASQYKSEFLANMSHELRTPLNSALILSRLLADNAQGNLTEEQVKFAHTIHASGTDLLTLINDILDLSKIEAGHVELHAEPLTVERLVADLSALFEPIAQDKGLTLSVAVDPDCPPVIESDRQRIEQVLKNLLANAIKFTDTGSVSVHVRAERGGRMRFDVIDTGIGIPADQQARIFGAFQQADGSISRRFGGTGLGLSISQELAHRLGGEITVASVPGQGSTFSLSIATRLSATAATHTAGRSSPALQAHALPAAPVPPPPSPAPTAGERAAPARPDGRLILIIEDEPVFADIVGERAEALGFATLVAGSAADGLRLAREQLPDAVVLDIGLPDQSGLYVLDILKHDMRTRHIPVHMVSATDHAHAALSLGAMGYLVKPVTSEALTDALISLERRLSLRPRRVLVVEDDAVQLDAVSRLLNSAEVETVGARTAAECLEQLAHQTFDCMVLDLSLPDTSGFALLETLSTSQSHAFPPVIVYTGRELSAAEEQRLRRYSRSIIIKGARSPERLLDEVTLFLHRVIQDLPESQQGMIRLAKDRDAVLEGKRILLAEDDVRNVFALMNVLEPHGCSVTIARNGQEAIDALADAAEPPVDLVLMDIMMPVKDGLTAMREIRQNPRWTRVPIIALTAKAMADDQAQCLAAGANDYMAKPLDVDKLLSLLRVWLAG